MHAALSETAKLNNGSEMPWLGFGVYQIPEGEQVEDAVGWALEAGYRSIDTASMYHNEGGVGIAVRESPVAREDIFITTKVWNDDQGYDSTLRAFDKSMERLHLDYIDLYLIHWPVGGTYLDTWRALERIYEDGRARAIGVSNFMVHHLEAVLNICAVKPAVNQIEFHPHLQQPELVRYCLDQDIQVEAWSPLKKGGLAKDPELTRIGQQYGKTAAQAILRWEIQRGIVTIPKSSHRERIEENANVFDFELSEDDMTAINAMDRGDRVGPHPDEFG